MPRISKPPETCEACPGWHWTRDHRGFSQNEGHGTNGVLIVGESLGANEESDGLPFRPYAASGSLLEKAIRVLGYSRDQFRLTNTLRCRPPHDKLAGQSYELEVLRHCRPHLDRSINEMKPRCILALGGIALRELTGMCGYKQGITYLRGFSLRAANGIPVVGSFHPSFLRQGKPHYFSVLLHDIKMAVEIARSAVPKPCPTWHILHPSLDDARNYLSHIQETSAEWLVYDIETPTSADADEDERDEDSSHVITQIQFSTRSAEGIVFPATPEYMEIARQIMKVASERGMKLAGFYNHLFDDWRLRANGFTFGETWDIYEMWHTMQADLPANLQFVGSFYGAPEPWKHLSVSDIEQYGCWDVDVPQRILQRLPDDLRKRGLWDSYVRRVHQVRPILDLMSERGIPINDERRIAFGGELDAEMKIEWEGMQAMVPEECREVHPKQGYKKVPKDTTGLTQREFIVASRTNPMIGDRVIRWCRIEPFTPSPKQLIRYMKFKGHSVPKNMKTDNDTTAAKELERLWKKTSDPLYRAVVVYRELQKMKGTYVDGWAPAADGRVHTTFTFAPATGQLSSRAPNVQNGPQHEKEGRETGLADKFNRCQEAPPGYRFVSFDHKSFHALTLAYLAQDPDYERVVRADVHSFLAGEFLKLKPAATVLAMPDDEMRDYLGWVKRTHRDVRDGKAKRTVLGWGFGMGARKLYQTYQESFTSEREAKRMIETLEGLFPKTVRYRDMIRHRADKDHLLRSAFDAIRWFWDVIDWRPPKSASRPRCAYCNQHHGWGDQSEEAIAYLPAATAFGMMREEALAMQERGWDERYGLINNIHDAWYFLCPDSLVDECITNIHALMESPSPYLKDERHPRGLSCATSVSVGRNLAKKSESNLDGKEEVHLVATSNVPA